MAGQDAGLVDNLASPCMPLAGCCLQAVPGGAASACNAPAGSLRLPTHQSGPRSIESASSLSGPQGYPPARAVLDGEQELGENYLAAWSMHMTSTWDSEAAN
jgi:hypothetical protein